MVDQHRFPNLAAAQPQSCANGRIRRIHKSIANIYRKHISPFGITGPQLSILFVCAKIDGMTQSRLAQILILEKSTASRNLRILLNKELLSKKAKVLKVTEAGFVLLEAVVPEWQKAKAKVKAIIGVDGDHALDQLLHQLSKSN